MAAPIDCDGKHDGGDIFPMESSMKSKGAEIKLFWDMISHGFSEEEAQAIAELSDEEFAEVIRMRDDPDGNSPK